MKKYIYQYVIYTNNLKYGFMKIKDGFNTIKEAKYYMSINNIQLTYGCCDIYKKRKYIQQ